MKWVGLSIACLGMAAFGCGGRTNLDVGQPPATDAGLRDAPSGEDSDIAHGDGGLSDTGLVDSSPPDVGVDANVEHIPCERDFECPEDLPVCGWDTTVEPIDLDPLPLSCQFQTGSISPRSECDTNDQCDHDICLISGTCSKPCLSDDDCDGSQPRCMTAWVHTSIDSMQPMSACVSWTDFAPDVEVTIEASRDSIPPGSIADLNVPGGRAFSLFIPQTPTLLVSDLIAAESNSEALWDINNWGGDTPFTFGFDGGGATLRLLVPTGPMSRILADDDAYLIEAYTWDGTRADFDYVNARRNAMPGTFHTLDLNFWNVGGLSTAFQMRQVQQAINDLGDIYDAAGITIGEVRYLSVTGGLRAQFEIIEADDQDDLPELRDMFPLSAGTGRPAINIFMVRSMDGALGVAGGIPGAWAVYGTGSSGIAIASELITPPYELGSVLGHEIGHFLGLFHTTEYEGFSFEPLSDTPVCDSSHDENMDTYVDPFECEDVDGGNMMFWAGLGNDVTEQQIDVMSAALILY